MVGISLSILAIVINTERANLLEKTPVSEVDIKHIQILTACKTEAKVEGKRVERVLQANARQKIA